MAVGATICGRDREIAGIFTRLRTPCYGDGVSQAEHRARSGVDEIEG